MQRVHETGTIDDVFAVADTLVKARMLKSGDSGIVVEVTDEGDVFEGTLVYFPGVTLAALKAED